MFHELSPPVCEQCTATDILLPTERLPSGDQQVRKEGGRQEWNSGPGKRLGEGKEEGRRGGRKRLGEGGRGQEGWEEEAKGGKEEGRRGGRKRLRAGGRG